MYIIVTYDVGMKRNSKVLKICRRYLIHVQKSVFEGFISENKLNKLKKELMKVIDTENDQIAIYRYDKGKLIKEVIGYHIEMDNII